MSPDQELSDDEMKMKALKLIQGSWKTITEEKKKGTDVSVAAEKITAARAAIKEKDFKSAYENAQQGSDALNAALGGGGAEEPAPAPTPVPAQPEAVDLENAAVAESPGPEAELSHSGPGASNAFSFEGEDTAVMPEVVDQEEVDAATILAQEEEAKKPAPPKPVLFLCFNCNEPISVTVPERPLIVKCPNCGIDGQID